MTTHMTKIWFDGENVVTRVIPEQELYKDDAIDLSKDAAIGRLPTKIFGPDLEPLLNSAGFYKKRDWVGLTGSEAVELWENTDTEDSWELIKRVEAKLKEKNNG